MILWSYEILLQRTTPSILPATNTKGGPSACYPLAWGLSDAYSVTLGAVDTVHNKRDGTEPEGKVACQKMGERAGGTADVKEGDVMGRPGIEVKPGQARALLKMAFVTWQQQFYMPFLLYFFC